MPVRTHAIENVDGFWNYESEQDTLFAEYIQSVEAIEDANKTRDKKQRATLGSPGR